MQPMRDAACRMTLRGVRLVLLALAIVPVPGQVPAEPVPAEIRALADIVRGRLAEELSGSRSPAVTVGLDALVTVPGRGEKEVRPLAGLSVPAARQPFPPQPRVKPPVPEASRAPAIEALAAAFVTRIGPVYMAPSPPPAGEALNGRGSSAVPR